MYETNKSKFKLKKDNIIHSTWDTYSDAIQAGYYVFGLDGFEIEEHPKKIHFISRDIIPFPVKSVNPERNPAA